MECSGKLLLLHARKLPHGGAGCNVRSVGGRRSAGTWKVVCVVVRARRHAKWGLMAGKTKLHGFRQIARRKSRCRLGWLSSSRSAVEKKIPLSIIFLDPKFDVIPFLPSELRYLQQRRPQNARERGAFSYHHAKSISDKTTQKVKNSLGESVENALVVDWGTSKHS